jgi:hypothetical protein
VDKLARTNAWLLVAPLLAVERGHNILNDEGVAALGAVYFLVRPHPRPDDITLAIQAINHWAIEQIENGFANAPGTSLDERGRKFLIAAYRQWRHLLHLPMVYSTLPSIEREAVTWSQLVSIWQVIGRLVRGGREARVYFCDAAFARRTADGDEGGDTPVSSLLVSMRRVLRPFFDDDRDVTQKVPSPHERALVRILYGPFYAAIAQIEGVADAIV